MTDVHEAMKEDRARFFEASARPAGLTAACRKPLFDLARRWEDAGTNSPLAYGRWLMEMAERLRRYAVQRWP